MNDRQVSLTSAILRRAVLVPETTFLRRTARLRGTTLLRGTAVLRGALLIAAASLCTACASAQDIPKGKAIQIHMSGSKSKPEGPNPYRIQKVLPNAKGVCRGSANQREDCYDAVTWELKGPDLPAGWYVELRMKQDATKACFTRAPFKITNNDPVESGPVDEKVCQRWDVWPYDVILFNDKGEEKGREDPLVVINH